MTDLEALAKIQDLDTHLDQLAHLRSNLPEQQEVDSLAGEKIQIDGRREKLSAERHELEREQKRFEDEVASIESKKQADNDRMYNTGMTSPKELSAIQDELASLDRRQNIVEEQVLEMMEQIEPLTDQLTVMDTRMSEIDSESGRLQAAIAVAEAEIDAESAALNSERQERVAEVRDDLLTRYEGLRGRSRGSVVIGRMTDGRCSACGLRLSSMFLDEAKHSDHTELMQCDECGVLLVS